MDTQMNRINYLAMRDAERNMLVDLKPNVMVTHNFGAFYKAPAQQKLLSWFYCAMQRHLYGRDWAARSGRLPEVYGYREHPNSNPHYHALARFEPTLAAALFCDGSEIWLLKV